MNSVKNALLDKTEMYEIDLWVITCPLVLFQALLTLLENYEGLLVGRFWLW